MLEARVELHRECTFTELPGWMGVCWAGDGVDHRSSSAASQQLEAAAVVGRARLELPAIVRNRSSTEPSEAAEPCTERTQHVAAARSRHLPLLSL